MELGLISEALACRPPLSRKYPAPRFQPPQMFKLQQLVRQRAKSEAAQIEKTGPLHGLLGDALPGDGQSVQLLSSRAQQSGLQKADPVPRQKRCGLSLGAFARSHPHARLFSFTPR